MYKPAMLSRNDDSPAADDADHADHLADDAALIARSRAEPEAFAAIFDRHATEIHRYVSRRLGAAIAEDVVGETFLTAFRRRDRYDLSYRDARPWLFGIATNMIGRHRQSEVRFYRALARTGIDPVVDPDDMADGVVARVAATGQRRAIGAALAELSPDDRDTVLLVDWAGLSYEQAASALLVPVGTVRSRLNRARRKVREALGGVNPILPTEEHPR
jgi:RNA polymerase sigma factor (sigma-70 family)